MATKEIFRKDKCDIAMISSEGYPIFKSTVDNSMMWKLWHGTNYLLGGILFVLGSLCYYPFSSNYVSGEVLGGWLFTIGSLNFLLADLTEWDHYKFGCTSIYDFPNLDKSCFSYLRRAEMGINFFISVIGSLLYLMGSIYFIPAMENILLGEYLFIYGSIIIFFSQFLKCYRSLITNEKDPSDKNIDIRNITSDTKGFMVDIFAGFGGLFYTIGTYSFMEELTEDDLILSVHFFILGGVSFFISGVFMQLRYFIKKNINDTIQSEVIHLNEANEKLLQ